MADHHHHHHQQQQQQQQRHDDNVRWEPVKTRPTISTSDDMTAEKYAKMRSSSFSDSIDRSMNQDAAAVAAASASSSSSSSPSVNEKPTTRVTISRSVVIPDRARVDRSHRLPEFGPVILFFSGGTAIKDLASVLKDFTYNSIHLITPFDSGGSSAEIRRAFDMLSVGDLRNRLLALSDKNESTMRNNPHIPTLMGHRLNKGGSEKQVRDELESILCGRHVLMRDVSMPMRSILQSHLRWFYSRMPDDFDLRGASIGNLIITGCFLEHERDIVTAIFLVSKFLAAKGVCRPLTAANLHIRALYDNGVEEVGQHRINEAKRAGVEKVRKIVHLDLVERLQDDSSTEPRQDAQTCHIDMVSADLVASADLVVIPMGSFFASIIVNLLPRGVGRAIVARKCPKIYIPNCGWDPEMTGYTLLECVRLIIDMVRADHTTDCDVPASDILNFVLIDTRYCVYCVPVDKAAIERLGVVVIDVPLVDDDIMIRAQSSRQQKSHVLDPVKVVEVLLSLSG